MTCLVHMHHTDQNLPLQIELGQVSNVHICLLLIFLALVSAEVSYPLMQLPCVWFVCAQSTPACNAGSSGGNVGDGSKMDSQHAAAAAAMALHELHQQLHQTQDAADSALQSDRHTMAYMQQQTSGGAAAAQIAASLVSLAAQHGAAEAHPEQHELQPAAQAIMHPPVEGQGQQGLPS